MTTNNNGGYSPQVLATFPYPPSRAYESDATGSATAVASPEYVTPREPGGLTPQEKFALERQIREMGARG